jgi:hypothetical protein
MRAANELVERSRWGAANYVSLNVSTTPWPAAGISQLSEAPMRRIVNRER